MAKKRGNGEGSVYRRKDGLWVGQYKVQTPQGTKKTKYVYCKTRKDAATKLAAAIAERDSGVVYDSGGVTVEDYLDEWLRSVRGTVRERTWKRSEDKHYGQARVRRTSTGRSSTLRKGVAAFKAHGFQPVSVFSRAGSFRMGAVAVPFQRDR